MTRNPRTSRSAEDIPVLVGILKSKRDLALLLDERWYRMPVAQAPARPFRYFAFYQPAAFGRYGKRIRYWAEVLQRDTRPRLNLLPHEPAHPRAREPYYRIRLGPVHELTPPIRNIHPRRVSFGFTTLARLRTARTILALFAVPDTEALLARALRRARIRADAQRYVTGLGWRYRLDFAIPCRRGAVAIECDNAKAHGSRHARARDREKDTVLAQLGWTVLRFPEAALLDDMPGCLARIRRATQKRGGVSGTMPRERKKQKICSRGHRYRGSAPCPVCYPGYYRKRKRRSES